MPFTKVRSPQVDVRHKYPAARVFPIDSDCLYFTTGMLLSYEHLSLPGFSAVLFITLKTQLPVNILFIVLPGLPAISPRAPVYTRHVQPCCYPFQCIPSTNCPTDSDRNNIIHARYLLCVPGELVYALYHLFVRYYYVLRRCSTGGSYLLVRTGANVIIIPRTLLFVAQYVGMYQVCFFCRLVVRGGGRRGAPVKKRTPSRFGGENTLWKLLKDCFRSVVQQYLL